MHISVVRRWRPEHAPWGIPRRSSWGFPGVSPRVSQGVFPGMSPGISLWVFLGMSPWVSTKVMIWRSPWQPIQAVRVVGLCQTADILMCLHFSHQNTLVLIAATCIPLTYTTMSVDFNIPSVPGRRFFLQQSSSNADC